MSEQPVQVQSEKMTRSEKIVDEIEEIGADIIAPDSLWEFGPEHLGDIFFVAIPLSFLALITSPLTFILGIVASAVFDNWWVAGIITVVNALNIAVWFLFTKQAWKEWKAWRQEKKLKKANKRKAATSDSKALI